MTGHVDFEPSSDPLYRKLPLRHVVEFPVVGLPVRFESNSAYVIGVVEEAFGVWARFDLGDALSAHDRLRVRLVIHEVESGPFHRDGLVYRVPDPDRVWLIAAGTMGVAEMARGETVAYIAPAVAADRDHFRYAVVEGLTLPLVTARDRQPIHAAAIARRGRALVLAGASGVGKSTLAFAAGRAGWEVIAEDELFLQIAPRFRVWGKPGPIHLPTDSRRHFPELPAETPSLLANGKHKLAVAAPRESPRISSPVLERARVCLLERGAERRPPVAITAEEVEQALGRPVQSGFDFFAETIGQRVRELARGGGWRITLSGSPDDAVADLDKILSESAEWRLS